MNKKKKAGLLAGVVLAGSVFLPSPAKNDGLLKYVFFRGISNVLPIEISDSKIGEYINLATKETPLPDYLSEDYIKRMIFVESGNNTLAYSSKGARGLMQMMPGAWDDTNKSDSYSLAFFPSNNIKTGVDYLEYLDNFLSKNHLGWKDLDSAEKRDLITAAYHEGPSRLKYRGFDIPKMPRETIKYVKDVSGGFSFLNIKKP